MTVTVNEKGEILADVVIPNVRIGYHSLCLQGKGVDRSSQSVTVNVFVGAYALFKAPAGNTFLLDTEEKTVTLSINLGKKMFARLKVM